MTDPSPLQPEDKGFASPPPEPAAPKRKMSPRFAIIAVVLAVAAVLLILFAWKLPPFSSAVQRTENAQVRGQVTVISPQVGGYVVEVLASDFQTVTAGQLLFRIDDRIYRQRLEQAQADLDARRAELANNTQTAASERATFTSRQAELAAAGAELERSRADMARVEGLAADGSVSLRERDQTHASLRAAEARVRQGRAAVELAQQDVISAQVNRGALAAAVEKAEAAVRLAEIDLENTRIVAPEAGKLGQIGTRRGQSVSAGTQLVALVPPQLWVIANFKERQTGGMIEGQTATITVDALGDRRFTGRVQHIAPATGSEFAVLPAQNATGNFTKVAQRLPVRIVLDPNQEGTNRLRPGLSVVASVDTASVVPDGR